MDDMQKLIDERMDEHGRLLDAVRRLGPDIARLAHMARGVLANGHRIHLCGNGGSAADAQHIAAELVGRFQCERRGLPAIALTTDTSILTAVANDYGFEQIFARQIQAHAQPGDMLIGLSTSGNSANVLAALNLARQMQCLTVGLLGRDGGQIAAAVDLAIIVPSPVTARVQEMHILIGHLLCELIESAC